MLHIAFIKLEQKNGGKMKLVKNQKGQGMTEYLILVALISVVSIGIVKGFGDTIRVKFNQMRTQINTHVSTDLAPLDNN